MSSPSLTLRDTRSLGAKVSFVLSGFSSNPPTNQKTISTQWLLLLLRPGRSAHALLLGVNPLRQLRTREPHSEHHIRLHELVLQGDQHGVPRRLRPPGWRRGGLHLLVGHQGSCFSSDDDDDDDYCMSCRKTNPDITEFMKQQSFGQDYSKLESFYIQKWVASRAIILPLRVEQEKYSFL